MNKSRLEAFSDGVLAIIITIMVLEIKVPRDANWSSLLALVPVFSSYFISFLAVGIYWGNHHHLLHATRKINSAILLSNLHLLFWLSLLPFATAWMGQNHFEINSIILYALVTILCGAAYGILQRSILQTLEAESPVVRALLKQRTKVVISLLAELAAIPCAFVHPVISGALFVFSSIIWLIPDRNLERALMLQTQINRTTTDTRS
jgi:uncharacterized membrane protein